MADYNCPTGECSQAKPCERVNEGDVIDPNSVEHLQRNACNYCPITPPEPVYVTRRVMRDGIFGPRWTEITEIAHFQDSEGNHWKPDNAVTAWWFHDDPFPGTRDHQNMTFRISFAQNGGRGWQCRYVEGALDDSTQYMGTYDYAEAGTPAHVNMDVSPHNANDNYTPNLTNQY